MVPNLLPFSTSVTIGGGLTQNAAAIPQAQPGFAAMLGMGATPVTQGSPSAAFSGKPVTVSILPTGTAPLLDLTDGALVQPVEAALPEMLNIADPVLATDAPIDAGPQPDAAPVVSETAPVGLDAAPIAATIPQAPAPAPANEAVSPPVDPVAPPQPSPVKTATPEGGTVTVIDGPDKPATPAPDPTETTVIVVDGPYKPATPPRPAPTGKPAPAPATDGDTVTTGDGPRKTIETAPASDPVTTVELPRKPVEPTPAPVPAAQHGSALIVEPPRKSVIPAPPSAPQAGSEPIVDAVRTTPDPAPAPSPDSDRVAVVDSPDKEPDPVPATPAVPTAAVPTLATPTDAMPTPAAPADAVSVPVLTDPAVPVIASAIETPAPVPLEDVSAPQISPLAIAAASLTMPAPATANPTPPQPGADAPSAPVAAPRPAETMQPTEPAASGIAIDAPVDDGAFDGLVADAAPEADPLRTSAETTSDTMNRDGNRQSALQSAAPAPTPTSAGPVPTFDPLAAAPAPDAPRATGESTPEPRARASALGEDVGLAIVRHADSGLGDILVIRLDPAELGKIEVRLRMDEARQLSAEVTADQPATLDLLRRDAENLTRALNDAGFRADDQSLRFDSRGFGQNDQQAQQGRRVASRAYLPEDDAAASSIPSPVQVRSSGRVDLVA
jgi:flagellar hook-length control protein FliK